MALGPTNAVEFARATAAVFWAGARRSARENATIITLPQNTSPQAEEVWINLLRQASVARRFALMSNLSAAVIRLSRKALRDARPGASDDELAVEFVRLNYGDAVADGLAAGLLGPERTGAHE